MALKLYNDTDIQNIADSIRAKTGKINTMTVSEMASEIDDITVTSEAKTVTSSLTTQVVTPSANIDYLTQVTINALPVTYVLNSAGGYTVTIG